MQKRLSIRVIATFVFLFSTILGLNGYAQKSDSSKSDSRTKSSSDQKKEVKTKYIQFRTEKGKPKAMQTAVSRFAADDGKSKVTVDLVGVVHIGDKSYYQAINKLLKEYDVVLYELVAPDDEKITNKKLAGSDNPLRMLQAMPQKMMGLDSQLENIDYEAKNFVHADLTPEEIAKKMAERGESTMTVVLDTLSEVIKKQNLSGQGQGSASDAAQANPLAMFGDPGKMKLMLAKQFVDSEALDMGLGTALNRILIQDRNEEAMKELSRQVFAGHKKVAIFYGAAHMPDFEKRLAKDYGLKLKSQKWLDAWDLTKKPSSSDDPTALLFELLKEFDK